MSASTALNCDSIRADDFLSDGFSCEACAAQLLRGDHVISLCKSAMTLSAATCVHFTCAIYSKCKLLLRDRHIGLQIHLKSGSRASNMWLLESPSWELLMASSSPTDEFHWSGDYWSTIYARWRKPYEALCSFNLEFFTLCTIFSDISRIYSTIHTRRSFI